MIRFLIATARRQLAIARLQRMVEANRKSFEITDYRKRREAALKARRV